MRGIKAPPRFILYRILGNDLPPRHGTGDGERVLRFILDHEPPLEQAEKRFILNGIADLETERRYASLLAERGFAVERIPFDRTGFAAAFFDASGMPRSENPFVPRPVPAPTRKSRWRAFRRKLKRRLLRRPPPEGPAFSLLPLPANMFALEWMLRHKSLAAIPLNRARNLAIEDGRAQGAEWILPLDGWTFFTEAGWSEVVSFADGHPDARYLAIPIARVGDASQLLQPGFNPAAAEEPQLALRHDARARFDETLRYGNRNKSDLLRRLGIPGNEFVIPDWEIRPKPPFSETGETAPACGWVARVPSGALNKVEASSLDRWKARFTGVLDFTRMLDAGRIEAAWTAFISREGFADTPEGRSVEATARAHLADAAAAAFEAPLRTVLDKQHVAPSGDKRHYLSAAPYRHVTGGAATLRDGARVAAAVIGSPESLAYDRTALDLCIRRAALLTCEGQRQGREDYLARAAEILRAWFADPATAMHPTFRYAQWPGEGEPSYWGLIDARDLWIMPLVAADLHRAGALPPEDLAALRAWADALFDDITGHKPGRAAYMATNNIGTFCHLLLASLALFSERWRDAADLLNAAPLRFAAACGPDNLPDGETGRAKPLHYCLFDLAGWFCLAGLGRAAGVDLWSYEGAEGQSLCAMFASVDGARDTFADYLETAPEKDARIERLMRMMPEDAAGRAAPGGMNPIAGAGWQNHADEGLPPLWPEFRPF